MFYNFENMSTSFVSFDKTTAAKLGFPTEDGCYEMANALQEGLSKEDVKCIYTDWANKNTGSYDEVSCFIYLFIFIFFFFLLFL